MKILSSDNQNMRARLFAIAGICLLAFPFATFAQTAAPGVKPAAPGSAATATGADPSSTGSETPDSGGIPGTYRSVSLGMSLEEAKKALLADHIFGYRGDRDVSLLPTMNRTLIETVGDSFIRRAWFQFHEEALYIMTFNMDPGLVDYYSIYKSLVGKYGEPSALDPRKAMWEDGKVTLSLERPLTVKYMDAEVFASLLGETGADKAAYDLLRENFVNGF